jgi:hypothetical protein
MDYYKYYDIQDKLESHKYNNSPEFHIDKIIFLIYKHPI